MRSDTPDNRARSREGRKKVIEERIARGRNALPRIVDRLGDEPLAGTIADRLEALLADFARRPDISELRGEMKYLGRRFREVSNAAENLRMVLFTSEELDRVEDWLHESDHRNGAPAGRQAAMDELHRLKDAIPLIEEIFGSAFDALKNVVARYLGEEGLARREGRPSPREPIGLAAATLSILQECGVEARREKAIVRDVLGAASLKAPVDLKDIMREARGKGRRVRRSARGKPSRRSPS